MTDPDAKPLPKRQRSAVTNRNRMFVAGDGNSAWARRHRDVLEFTLADIGPVATLSQAQISIATRAATLTCQLEAMDGKLSMGEVVDLDLYSRVAGHVRRLHETLGIKRNAKKGANPLLDHFAKPPARKAAA